MRRTATVVVLTAAALTGPLAAGALAAPGHKGANYAPGSCSLGPVAQSVAHEYGGLAKAREAGDPPAGHFLQFIRTIVVADCQGRG